MFSFFCLACSFLWLGIVFICLFVLSFFLRGIFLIDEAKQAYRSMLIPSHKLTFQNSKEPRIIVKKVLKTICNQTGYFGGNVANLNIINKNVIKFLKC